MGTSSFIHNHVCIVCVATLFLLYRRVESAVYYKKFLSLEEERHAIVICYMRRPFGREQWLNFYWLLEKRRRWCFFSQNMQQQENDKHQQEAHGLPPITPDLNHSPPIFTAQHQQSDPVLSLSLLLIILHFRSWTRLFVILLKSHLLREGSCP